MDRTYIITLPTCGILRSARVMLYKGGSPMASINGICKNCGSLIVTDDRDAMCECLFCDCVFPTLEAIEISKHPQDYTFPNDPQPKRDGIKRYTAIPVFPDPVAAAVKQASTLSAAKPKEKNPYEVSPDDIKAPAKTLWTVVGIAAAVVMIVALGFLPFYLDRTNRREALTSAIDKVFADSGYTVNTSLTGDYPVGYSINGQNNNLLKVVTTAEEITLEQLNKTYEAFAALRADEYGYDPAEEDLYYKDIRVEIVAGRGSYIIWTSENAKVPLTDMIPFESENT